jgi:hypothetical protein
MARVIYSIVTAVALVLASWPARAHHSVLAFDNEHGRIIAGVITEVKFAYPHTRIVVEVSDSDASRRTWQVEAEGAGVLERLGWHDDSIGPGDQVAVHGAPARDGSSAMRCKTVTLGDEIKLPCFPGAAQLLHNGQEPSL